MSAASAPRPLAAIASLLAAFALAGPALADTASRPAPQVTAAPPAELSAEQIRALAAKRDGDPGTRQPLVSDVRTAKITASPPHVPLPAPQGTSLAEPRPSSKLADWQNMAHTLGPLPRPSWTVPWFMKKPSDKIVSRPLRPEETPSREADRPGTPR